MPTIRILVTDDERARALDVIAQLRPHLGRDTFLAQARRQTEAHGWTLAAVEHEGAIVACAGFRVGEWLAWGKTLYVDDLVTDARVRSSGHGGALFDWLVSRAREAGCVSLHLDSGVQRFAAHRFYLNKRMDITSHHFALALGPAIRESR
jgi:N-acetylglutamate synthase-like GNAT family acetyltransferase